MKILNAQQGTTEWSRLRAEHYRTASRASAMIGASPYQSRQQLLAEIHRGFADEVDADTQRLFDRGHAIEEAARPQAEEIIGEDLYPITALSDDGHLLASLDGATMLGDVIWECKTYSQAKAEEMAETGQVPKADYWQVVQQLVVSGAEKCLYMLHDGEAKKAFCWATLDPKDAEKLRAGWAQFDADLAAFVPPEPKAPEPVAAPVEGFGSLVLRVEGRVVNSNLDQFKAGAEAFLARLPRPEDLQTDQDFADADAAVKACTEAESRIKAQKEAAMAQMADVDALLRTVDGIGETIRAARLSLDKLVKARKQDRRVEIIEKACDAIAEHYRQINESLTGAGLHPPGMFMTDVAEEMKGKRTISSLLEAADKVLTAAKLDANERANRVRECQAVMIAEAGEHRHLFPDAGNLVTDKAPDDLRNLVRARIAEHAEREAAKIREAEERAAAKARAEEQAQAAQAPEKPTEPRQPEAVQSHAPAENVDEENDGDSTESTIRLKDINDAISPLTISQAGLSELGIESVGREKSAVLYRGSDFRRICSRLIGRLHAATLATQKEAA